MKRVLRQMADASLGVMGYKLTRTSSRWNGAGNAVHFLHIGKNAGTQIMMLIAMLNAERGGRRFVHHGHELLLRDLPPEAEYFFSMRDPVSRFRSAFHSRKRKGQPRLYVEWTPFEAQAFETFEHANDLAEALFADGDLGRQAFGAINAIYHTGMNQVDWFTGCGDIFELRPPLAIIRQEHLERDFEAFKRKLGIDLDTPIERDAVAAHKNDYAAVPELSEKAIANLRTWYAQDVEFYRWCENWVETST